METKNWGQPYTLFLGQYRLEEHPVSIYNSQDVQIGPELPYRARLFGVYVCAVRSSSTGGETNR